MRNNTLLITASINIKPFNVPFTALVNTEERLLQYLYSLKYAIANYHTVENIIFCENTAYIHDYSEIQEMAEQYGKNIEILSFMGDYTAIQQQGKGYGEGEIIEYALNHSKLMNKCDSFYKITGRLVVMNFDKLTKNTNNNLFIFWPAEILNEPPRIDTCFYKVDCSFYKRNLIYAYKTVSDVKGCQLENVYYTILFNHRKEIASFEMFPVIKGQSGTHGKKYDRSKIRLLKSSIYLKLGIHDLYKTWWQKFFLFIIKCLLKLCPNELRQK